MSPQNPSLVTFKESSDINNTHLPVYTESQLLNWAYTKGAVTSVAKLKDPSSILLRLDQGQRSLQTLQAQDWRNPHSSGPFLRFGH